jgi:LysR family malonate utilization transcriptional regulator
VDLRQCRDEPFVSLGDGFVTSSGFAEAFRIADFTPNVVMKVGDIFSLMNLVGGGIGYSLLPGRVRDVFARNVAFVPLTADYGMKQTIGLSFLRRRERDPNLLALAAVCRMLTQAGGAPCIPRRISPHHALVARYSTDGPSRQPSPCGTWPPARRRAPGGGPWRPARPIPR